MKERICTVIALFAFVVVSADKPVIIGVDEPVDLLAERRDDSDGTYSAPTALPISSAVPGALNSSGSAVYGGSPNPYQNAYLAPKPQSTYTVAGLSNAYGYSAVPGPGSFPVHDLSGHHSPTPSYPHPHPHAHARPHNFHQRPVPRQLSHHGHHEHSPVHHVPTAHEAHYAAAHSTSPHQTSLFDVHSSHPVVDSNEINSQDYYYEDFFPTADSAATTQQQFLGQEDPTTFLDPNALTTSGLEFEAADGHHLIDGQEYSGVAYADPGVLIATVALTGLVLGGAITIVSAAERQALKTLNDLNEVGTSTNELRSGSACNGINGIGTVTPLTSSATTAQIMTAVNSVISAARSNTCINQ